MKNDIFSMNIVLCFQNNFQLNKITLISFSEMLYNVPVEINGKFQTSK